MNKKYVEIAFKKNNIVNEYQFFDNAVLIWNPERKNIKDYNFDHALSYDCIQRIDTNEEYLLIHYDSGSDCNYNVLKLKKIIENKIKKVLVTDAEGSSIEYKKQ